MWLLTTNHAVHIRLTLNWQQHLSLSAPQDPSAPLHLFTSHVSFHLSTHHSSLYLWPNTQFHRLPTALTASHPPFNTIIFFFQTLLPPFIPSPLSQPPTLISLPFFPNPSHPPLSLTHSVIHPPTYFAVPSACTERNRRYYLPIWHHSHLLVFFCRCLYTSVWLYVVPKTNRFKLGHFCPQKNYVFFHQHTSCTKRWNQSSAL